MSGKGLSDDEDFAAPQSVAEPKNLKRLQRRKAATAQPAGAEDPVPDAALPQNHHTEGTLGPTESTLPEICQSPESQLQQSQGGEDVSSPAGAVKVSRYPSGMFASNFADSQAPSVQARIMTVDHAPCR